MTTESEFETILRIAIQQKVTEICSLFAGIREPWIKNNCFENGPIEIESIVGNRTRQITIDVSVTNA